MAEGPFLVAAAPGAGKTRPALALARELLRAGAVRRVAVVCPTTPLTRQWARAAARLGVHLVPDAADLRPPRDFDGVAVTYARVAAAAARLPMASLASTSACDSDLVEASARRTDSSTRAWSRSTSPARAWSEPT